MPTKKPTDKQYADVIAEVKRQTPPKPSDGAPIADEVAYAMAKIFDRILVRLRDESEGDAQRDKTPAMVFEAWQNETINATILPTGEIDILCP